MTEAASEEEAAGEETVAPEAAVSEGISDPGKCTRQLVLSAERNAKSLSSQLKAGRFTAKNVS